MFSTNDSMETLLQGCISACSSPKACPQVPCMKHEQSKACRALLASLMLQILLLDEATAALDSKSERLVQQVRG